MLKNFDDCFKMLIVHEGGFTNDPRDGGGMTNWGVTHIDWAAWIGHEPSEAEMRAITKDDVKPLYKRKYWDNLHCDELPSGLDWAVMDFGVNSGIGRSAKYLQRLVGVKDDGAIGPVTLAAVKAHDTKDLIEKLCAARMAFLQKLSNFDHFGKGWTRRVQDVEAQAKEMVA
ncbi:lysozyme [Caudoviricetes sp.]|nr:lysozyme [Caudoviricetes sp.]